MFKLNKTTLSAVEVYLKQLTAKSHLSMLAKDVHVVNYAIHHDVMFGTPSNIVLFKNVISSPKKQIDIFDTKLEPKGIPSYSIDFYKEKKININKHLSVDKYPIKFNVNVNDFLTKLIAINKKYAKSNSDEIKLTITSEGIKFIIDDKDGNYQFTSNECELKYTSTINNLKFDYSIGFKRATLINSLRMLKRLKIVNVDILHTPSKIHPHPFLLKRDNMTMLIAPILRTF